MGYFDDDPTDFRLLDLGIHELEGDDENAKDEYMVTRLRELREYQDAVAAEDGDKKDHMYKRSFILKPPPRPLRCCGGTGMTRGGRRQNSRAVQVLLRGSVENLHKAAGNGRCHIPL